MSTEQNKQLASDFFTRFSANDINGVLSEMTDVANPLPREVRQNVANLGLFVMNHTVSVLSDPRPEQLHSLIGINRELAAGLLGRA